MHFNHVTGILANCNLREWPAHYSDDDREFYLRRGQWIHKATALYDKNILDWETVEPRILGFIKAWAKFRNRAGGKITAIEMSVENIKLGYRGTLDRILTGSNIYPGHFLFDIKTNEADIYTRLQTMGYSMAQKKQVKRGHVSLFADGKYKVGFYDDDRADRAAWLACLTLNSWVERNSK
jgi:hypothetical protein